jgi:hypothetical protein
MAKGHLGKVLERRAVDQIAVQELCGICQRTQGKERKNHCCLSQASEWLTENAPLYASTYTIADKLSDFDAVILLHVSYHDRQ